MNNQPILICSNKKNLLEKRIKKRWDENLNETSLLLILVTENTVLILNFRFESMAENTISMWFSWFSRERIISAIQTCKPNIYLILQHIKYF